MTFVEQGRPFNEDEWTDLYDKTKSFEEQKEER